MNRTAEYLIDEVQPPIPGRYRLFVLKYKGIHHIQFLQEHILGDETVSSFIGEVGKIVKTSPSPRILLDFYNVNRMASRMIGKILNVHLASVAYGGKLVLCSIQPELARIFQITQLDRVVHITKDASEGFEALKIIVSSKIVGSK